MEGMQANIRHSAQMFTSRVDPLPATVASKDAGKYIFLEH